jgi:hypothetical protein
MDVSEKELTMTERVYQKKVHCYAQFDGNQWSAVCLDFTLAAQADTLELAKQKLSLQIDEYIEEALTIDQDHARELLSRSAPFSEWAKYYLSYCLLPIQKAANIIEDAILRQHAPKAPRARVTFSKLACNFPLRA